MSRLFHDNNVVLQGLLNKVLLYRFTRNLDKELQDRKISHSEISGSTGRSSNWFNRTFNELEDMKISTFIKTLSAINKIISDKSSFKPVEIQSVIDNELLKIASVFIDVTSNDIDYLLHNDPEIEKFFVDIKFYVDALMVSKVLTDEEVNTYEKIMNRISNERNSTYE